MESLKYKSIIFVIFLLITTLFILPAGEDLFSRGEEAFLNNNPELAVSFLEPAVDGGIRDKKAYLYLGIAMQQLGRYQKAVETFSLGIERTPPPYDTLYFNMGNNYFIQGQNDSAERAYSKALEENDTFAPAILNRANTRMRLDKWVKAIGDYRLYLIHEEDSPQKDVILELISRIQSFMAEQERLRQEEEAYRQAEEARQRALLESVLSSLDNAEDDTVNMRADSEDIESFEMELDIED